MLGGFTEVWIAFVILWVWLRFLLVYRPTWRWLSWAPYGLGGGACAAFVLALSAIPGQLPGAAGGDVQSTLVTFMIAQGLMWVVAAASLTGNIYWTWAHFTTPKDGSAAK
jgi:hypothetical protein